MATKRDLDNIFGYMPFDHFLIDKWDPGSLSDQNEQERNLVKQWISLGRRDRSPYIDRCREDGQIPVPDHIPNDLLAFEKRRAVDPDEWGNASAVWVRTWYGNELGGRDHPPEEVVTRATANAEYERLWQKALWPPEMHGFDDHMFGPYVFDDDAAAYGVSVRDADDELKLMDQIPSFVLNALVRCPDAMEGGHRREAEEDGEQEWSQALLVVVADGEACEDGWVLLLAINDRGQVLHNRVRCKASAVGCQVAFWRDDCEPLDIKGTRDNVMDYLDPNQSGNGWDDG